MSRVEIAPRILERRRKRIRRIINAAVPKRDVVIEGFIEGDGLSRAQREVAAGKGLVIATNHFSIRDMPEVLKEVGFLFGRPILLPIAFHQQQAFKPIVAIFGPYLAFETMPIVTRDTIIKGKNKGKKEGEGLLEYLMQAREYLANGHVVILAPQGGRREFLGTPEASAVGTLYRRSLKHNIDFNILYAGLGIRGAESYKLDEAGGFNLRRVYSIFIGPMETKSDLARFSGKGQRMAIDEHVFDQLSHLVPPEYLRGNA